jgi:RIP homotypic interaction motif
MSAFKRLMKDTVFIVKPDGQRLGPYQAAVSPDAITIMEKSMDVDEGDHVARSIPSGKEEIYLVLSADYSHGLHSIPPSYTLKVRKTTALSARPAPMKSTTVNIHNSTGVQVGDYNTQHIQATFNELIQRIEQSSASPAEKTEAKGRLAAFLEHPLVSSVLGGAAGSVLGALGGA